MENANLWTRRSNKDGAGKSDSSRGRSSGRFDGPHNRSNPFNAISPLSTGVSSPSVAASSAFGLGSGAFASFGSTAKTSKTPNSLDFIAGKQQSDKRDIQADQDGGPWKAVKSKASSSSLDKSTASVKDNGVRELPLKSTWIVWYRPPTPKYSDYEKSTIPLASISSVEGFWTVYSHLKRPSLLPTVSDYHIFKKNIRPVWEDEANKKGGKWIIRLKKGVADRYWEDLLLAMVGDQFAEASEEVCGAVLSVRSGEDVLSIWTKIDGGRNIKIRETIKRLLAFPPDTNIIWKSHDDSIAQRSAIDQARLDKTGGNTSHHHHHHHNQGADRRRNTNQEDSTGERVKSVTNS
ncbi:eukaryotic translation initiation factor 4E-4 [Arthroderma uncinatum]|uniref:eukaryotic translation initiation factor 4E-4 n=1 Tax=Arthroderma uncinatum TaxID=74035 RepID=UPI00144AF3D5|nr:eukaryotic translation initiation factor 4E-4 [Arthroderma uncinatum]KAF3479522.1 eukaryotic translation initiation factor 4E-4 [Arthroderma uncinatum]